MPAPPQSMVTSGEFHSLCILLCNVEMMPHMSLSWADSLSWQECPMQVGRTLGASIMCLSQWGAWRSMHMAVVWGAL